MTDHDPLDRRLRDAGRRLRATAPTPAATDAALDTLDGRRPPSHKARWIAPLAFVAAAAAVIGVLVVTRPEEAGRVVPADSGPPVATPQPTTVAPTTVAPTTVAPTTTEAPTTTSTTSTTAPPPPTAAAFLQDYPLDAPTAVVGCPGTFGDLAAVIAQEMWPIVGLTCAGDHGLAVAIGLPDGSTNELTWNGSGWTNDGYGTSHPCDVPDDFCAAFGQTVELYDATRPLPPAWLVEDPNYRPAEDATDFVAGLGVSVTGDAEAFATALGAALQAVTSGDPVPGVETELLDDVPVVAVTLSGIPDDSSSRQVYVVTFDDLVETLTPTSALRFIRCDRGVTTDGLCL